MWNIIAIVLIILGPAVLITYFIVDGYQAYQQAQAVRAKKREEREAAREQDRQQRQRLDELVRQRELEDERRLSEHRAKQRAEIEAANKPVLGWWLGVKRVNAAGKAMDDLYYRLDNYNPEWTEEIMKAYEEAENADKNVVVLPHVGITVRTKTAIRIRIREVHVSPHAQPTFVI